MIKPIFPYPTNQMSSPANRISSRFLTTQFSTLNSKFQTLTPAPEEHAHTFTVASVIRLQENDNLLLPQLRHSVNPKKQKNSQTSTSPLTLPIPNRQSQIVNLLHFQHPPFDRYPANSTETTESAVAADHPMARNYQWQPIASHHPADRPGGIRSAAPLR
jgi:hypothetical protein